MGLIAARRPKDASPAGDLSARLDAVMRRSAAVVTDETGEVFDPKAHAVGVLDAALSVIAEASRVMRDAAAAVIEAAARTTDAQRAILAERYDDGRERIDAMQAALPHDAGLLLAVGAQPLDVPLRGAVYAVAPFPLGSDEAGLDLPPPEDGFASHQEVAETLRRVEIALERLSRVRAIYLADRAFLSGGS